jgi:hypothetical protein
LVVAIFAVAFGGVNEVQTQIGGQILGYFQHRQNTVATLPVCNAAYDGTRADITDNLAIPNPGANPGGGGTNPAVVRCDGPNSQWVIQQAVAVAFVASPTPTPCATPTPLAPIFTKGNFGSGTTATMSLTGARNSDFVLCSLNWVSAISAPVYNTTLSFNSVLGSLSTYNTTSKADRVYYRWLTGNSTAPVVNWTTASTGSWACAMIPNIPTTSPFYAGDFPFDQTRELTQASAATSTSQLLATDTLNIHQAHDFALFLWDAPGSTVFTAPNLGGLPNTTFDSGSAQASTNGSSAFAYNTDIGTNSGNNITGSAATVALGTNFATETWNTTLIQNPTAPTGCAIPYTVPAFPNFTGNGLQTFSVGAHTYNGHAYTVHGDGTAAGGGTDDTAALNDALIAGDVQLVPSTNACTGLPGGHCGYKIVGTNPGASGEVRFKAIAVPGNRQIRGNSDGSQASLNPGNAATLINPEPQADSNARVSILFIANSGGIYTGSNIGVYGVNFRGINTSIPVIGARFDGSFGENQALVWQDSGNIVMKGNDFASAFGQSAYEAYGAANPGPVADVEYNSGANNALYCLVFDNAWNSTMSFNTCTDASIGSEEDSSTQTPTGDTYNGNIVTADCNARTGTAPPFLDAELIAEDGVCGPHGANCSGEHFTNNTATGFTATQCGVACGTGGGGNIIQCSVIQHDQDSNLARRPSSSGDVCTNGCILQ